MTRAWGLALLLGGCSGSGSRATSTTVHPPSMTTGGNGTSGNPSLGQGSVHSDDGFDIVADGAVVRDADGGAVLQRAVVTVSADALTACDQRTAQNVRLAFGTPGVPLTAGSYLVDAGAVIVWDPGSIRAGQALTAVNGLINCNAVTPTAVGGSYSVDLPLPDGGLSRLSGIFTAVPCDP